jgi:hypothetical protein
MRARARGRELCTEELVEIAKSGLRVADNACLSWKTNDLNEERHWKHTRLDTYNLVIGKTNNSVSDTLSKMVRKNLSLAIL